MDVDSVAVEVDAVAVVDVLEAEVDVLDVAAVAVAVLDVAAVEVDVLDVEVDVAAVVEALEAEVDVAAVEVAVLDVAAVEVDVRDVEVDVVAVEVDGVVVEVAVDVVPIVVDVDTLAAVVDVDAIVVDVDEVDLVAVEVELDVVVEVDTLAVEVDEVAVEVEGAVDVDTVVDTSAEELKLSEDSTSGPNGAGRAAPDCCERSALCLSAIMLRISLQTWWAADSSALSALRVCRRFASAHFAFDEDLACVSARVEARALLALIPKLGVTDVDSIAPVNIRQMRIAAPQSPRNMHHLPVGPILTDHATYLLCT